MARLVVEAGPCPLVVVLSKIAANPDELGITADFAAAADEFVRVLADAGRDLNPAQVRWIAHHGPFSSYDPAGPETFTEIALVFDGQHYQDDLAGDLLLTPDDMTQRITPLGLKPVPEVVADFGHLD